MNAPEKFLLPDIQSIRDTRSVAIDRVGIRGLLHPVTVRKADRTALGTVAEADMYVRLPADAKGTHMSRFVEILQEHAGEVDTAGLRAMFASMLSRLDAQEGCIELRFPYFISKRAPVSGVESLLDYRVVLRVEGNRGSDASITLSVTAPVTSLCPCSREISDYGAHNQRSHITISALCSQALSIEDLVSIAEEEASCEVFGLLKRPDEKWVTERAYDNPKFVEDLVRDIALRLDRDDRVRRYSVSSENFESIHNHSAFASIVRDKSVSP